jgi:hypothetical protein
MRAAGIGDVLFVVGDYVAAGLIGAVTAAAVHVVVNHGTDMVLAMLVGAVVGLVVHVVIGLVLAPLLGAFHVMLPGGLIGMYGGMVFAMRDSMQSPTLRDAVVIGAVFGIVIMAAVHLYDVSLRAGQRAGG